MSPDMKRRLGAVLGIFKAVVHYGYMPLILYLGFLKGSEPGMPVISPMSLMLRSLTRRVVMNKWSAPAALSHPIFHPDLVSLKPGTREYSIVSSPDASYGEAIVALNGLQSNAETLRKGKQRPHTDENLSKVNQYLSRIGLSPSDLNALHAMHVAGTKGKGSTSAFVEQLLRDSGFRTGMFTSPHLISVNERIKIDGIPLTKGRFAEYFWHVYNALDAAKEGDEDMPSYFRMLTVLAFSVFLKENVDVAVIEVGVGGEYDCTNVLPCPKVCIITTLDYDHTKILGNTLGEIAWQKAGILKPDVPCVVAYNQVDEALEVIKKRSVEKKCQIMVAPSFESYISTTPIELGIKGKVQQVNASVAIQAVELWKKRMREHVAADSVDCVPVETLDEEVINSLKRCWLPGRAQIISKNGIKFCLDGAHTVGSLKACMEWFESVLNNGAREFNKMKCAEIAEVIVLALIFAAAMVCCDENTREIRKEQASSINNAETDEKILSPPISEKERETTAKSDRTIPEADLAESIESIPKVQSEIPSPAADVLLLKSEPSTLEVYPAENASIREDNGLKKSDDESAAPLGDIDTFSDWTKKKLEAVAKERESASVTAPSSVPVISSPTSRNVPGQGAANAQKGKSKRIRKNFASADCGAKVLAANAEAQSAPAMLSSGMDEYFLSPCVVKNSIYFVIELCEAIEPNTFEMGNFELYSSSPKNFALSISDRYPTREWNQLGMFEARDVRGVQNFTVSSSSRLFGKYVKVDILSHFGSEHFCPISVFRVYGTSELEAMEDIHADRHGPLSRSPSGSLYSLDEDGYIDDGEDDNDVDVMRPKNLFGSAKDAVMSIVKRAAEAFTTALDTFEDAFERDFPFRNAQFNIEWLNVAAPEQIIDAVSNVTTAIAVYNPVVAEYAMRTYLSRNVRSTKSSEEVQVTEDGGAMEGPLMGWKGKCACPSRWVPEGVSGEAWDAFSCSNADVLLHASPRSWRPCFESMVMDVRARSAGTCSCNGISLLFASYLTEPQILALGVAERLESVRDGEFRACDGRNSFNESAVKQTVASIPETPPSAEAGDQVENPIPVILEENSGRNSSEMTKEPQSTVASNSIRTAPEKVLSAPSSQTVMIVEPTPVIDIVYQETRIQSSPMVDIAPALVIPSSTSVPTDASFVDPGEKLPPSDEPTETVSVMMPSVVDSKPINVIDNDDATIVAKAEDTLSSKTTLEPLQEAKPVKSETEGNGFVIMQNLPNANQPAGNKETAFLRLTNRVKALELNLTLSSLYLDELSKRYKRQVEDLTKAVNKYQQQVSDYAAVSDSLKSQLEIVNTSLASALSRIGSYESNAPVSSRVFIASQVLMIFIIFLSWRLCRTERSPAPVSETAPPVTTTTRPDPTVAPVVMRPTNKRNSYAWLESPLRAGVVCGRAVPVSSGSSPSRRIQLLPTVVSRSRAPSYSGDEVNQTRLRLISGADIPDDGLLKKISNGVNHVAADSLLKIPMTTDFAIQSLKSDLTAETQTTVLPARRHSFTCDDDVTWVQAGPGKQKQKPSGAKKRSKKKNKSVWDLNVGQKSRSGIGTDNRWVGDARQRDICI
ncbi:unnamed protein product [Notodromas monacha]|uniref:tetrahydrofolate synthase n=1 Tax=Notodromas monacha TaxID=399045 RepID=A0A7R9BLM5_9CRUS|nr:unnamed protein product [Notodromas monacha]CAG0916437.1 unnamed protein product [Notodromas monacha]